MITTRNRVEELKHALDQISHLDPAPAELMVTADGCEDGTLQFLNEWKSQESMNSKFKIRNSETKVQGGAGEAGTGAGGQKTVAGGQRTERRVMVNPVGLGSVASRDRMMREAKGEFVLALDDDSYPEQMNCLETIAKIFQERPRLAVASFPQRTEEYPETLTQADYGAEHPVRSFASSGACLRASAYRSLPGFEPMFFHMYEEPDYALQCVANGWEVRFFPQIIIRHHWTGSGRSEIRNHHRHARNELWSTLMRCPMPQALALVAYRIFSQARYAASRGPGWIFREPIWWWKAVQGTPRAIKRRRSVGWEGYREWLGY